MLQSRITGAHAGQRATFCMSSGSPVIADTMPPGCAKYQKEVFRQWLRAGQLQRQPRAEYEPSPLRRNPFEALKNQIGRIAPSTILTRSPARHDVAFASRITRREPSF